MTPSIIEDLLLLPLQSRRDRFGWARFELRMNIGYRGEAVCHANGKMQDENITAASTCIKCITGR